MLSPNEKSLIVNLSHRVHAFIGSRQKALGIKTKKGYVLHLLEKDGLQIKAEDISK